MKTLIHVAADESPPDATMYGLCCEYVQTIMQLSKLYRYAWLVANGCISARIINVVIQSCRMGTPR